MKDGGSRGNGALAAIGGFLAIVVAIITILQFAGVAKLQCLWSPCNSPTPTPPV